MRNGEGPQPKVDVDSPEETIVILDSESMDSTYRLDDVDSLGLHLTRIIDGEPSHEETLTWNEAARMIRKNTMRVYDIEPDKISNLS